jgi:hypothetical protein
MLSVLKCWIVLKHECELCVIWIALTGSIHQAVHVSHLGNPMAQVLIAGPFSLQVCSGNTVKKSLSHTALAQWAAPIYIVDAIDGSHQARVKCGRPEDRPRNKRTY